MKKEPCKTCKIPKCKCGMRMRIIIDKVTGKPMYECRLHTDQRVFITPPQA